MLEHFRIRVFRAVAHHLNFSRAAEELSADAARGHAADQGIGRGDRLSTF